MRKTVLSAMFLMLSACASQGGSAGVGYIVETRPDPITGKMVEKTYSPYYELEQANSDSGLITRLVITLGPERVPKGYQHTGPFASNLSQAYRDGIVDWASEIYFINPSKQEIVIEPKTLQVGRMKKSFSGSVTIAPSKSFITDPLIELASNYGTQKEISFEYKYKDQVVVVKGLAKRLTVDEVKKKYGAKQG